MTNKDSPYQCLGEGIHQVLHRRYLVNHYITPLYYINTLEHKQITSHSLKILEYMLDIV